MNELKAVSKLVKVILEENSQTRNSDNLLYLKLLEHQSEKKGLDLKTMTVPTFLLNMEQFGFSAFETVRRSRQKVQATYPELGASGAVGTRRMKHEKVYREFATSEDV